MDKKALKEFLNEKYRQYNQPAFIEQDPIQIPHQFTGAADREISGFFAAILAWGQRPTIIRNANRLMQWMDNAPHDFICNHTMEGFVHRTFNFEDLRYFLISLQRIYKNHHSMEDLFLPREGELNLKHSIHRFREEFFSLPHLSRSEKHISNPLKNSACKRINMYLRWMVRGNSNDVDFGIWKRISPSLLSCPLDVHSGRVARKLGLLHRKQDDWKAVEELDAELRQMDPSDPVKYDFALYGLGVFEKF